MAATWATVDCDARHGDLGEVVRIRAGGAGGADPVGDAGGEAVAGQPGQLRRHERLRAVLARAGPRDRGEPRVGRGGQLHECGRRGLRAGERGRERAGHAAGQHPGEQHGQQRSERPRRRGDGRRRRVVHRRVPVAPRLGDGQVQRAGGRRQRLRGRLAAVGHRLCSRSENASENRRVRARSGSRRVIDRSSLGDRVVSSELGSDLPHAGLVPRTPAVTAGQRAMRAVGPFVLLPTRSVMPSIGAAKEPASGHLFRVTPLPLF
ncbi:hypothetical protein BJF78_17450 [Pseudonocardia sp. CNS-139]|nr:hypothetical protein BJF78_17450 [Pseudonocardia sp. CNS-139]